MSDRAEPRPQGVQPPVDGEREPTAYQLTLGAMIFPVWGHWIFNAASAASLALVGAPALALAWLPAVCLSDVVLQFVYRRWMKTAREEDSRRGLRRLSWFVLAKTCLWFSASTLYVAQSHSMPGLGLLAVNAVSMVALGVSLGWTSRGTFAAMVVPPVFALTLACVAAVGLGP
ncbi:MAG TPA: hypothetical protein VGC92_16680, partial [Phenylobacterium sp.]